MSAHIEAEILRHVTARGPEKSICPSEVARSLDPDGWEKMMTAVRRAAVRLAQGGKIDILRKGRTVNPADQIKGVIRLRLRPDQRPGPPERTAGE